MKNAKDFAVLATAAAVGVILAGLVMSNLRDIALIDNAHNGFDS